MSFDLSAAKVRRVKKKKKKQFFLTLLARIYFLFTFTGMSVVCLASYICTIYCLAVLAMAAAEWCWRGRKGALQRVLNSEWHTWLVVMAVLSFVFSFNSVM